jgi:hypothetical protein
MVSWFWPLGRSLMRWTIPGGWPSRGLPTTPGRRPRFTRTGRERRVVGHYRVVRPGQQQRLRVQQSDPAVRMVEFEQVPADGTHRHADVDQGSVTMGRPSLHHARRHGC